MSDRLAEILNTFCALGKVLVGNTFVTLGWLKSVCASDGMMMGSICAKEGVSRTLPPVES